MNFTNIREDYSDYAPAFPSDWKKPLEEELNRIEDLFNIKFSDEFKNFQLIECHKTPMGDFAFDNFGWASPTLGPMENLSLIVQDAQDYGIPTDLAPFKCDNSDYFCISKDGAVVIWEHDSNSICPDKEYKWDSFIDGLYASFNED